MENLLGSEYGILTGHSPPQSPIEFGAQRKLAQLASLSLSQDESLLLKTGNIQSVQAAGDLENTGFTAVLGWSERWSTAGDSGHGGCPAFGLFGHLQVTSVLS